MAYIQSSGGDPIPPETLTRMAEVLGFSIPAEDLDAISVALRDQLDSIKGLEDLDLEGIGPIHRFDARWYE